MIIEFPNVMFRWHNSRRGICGIEDYITDFEKKRYGYNLKAGQCIYRFMYFIDHHNLQIYHASVCKVNKEGVWVSDWMERGWEIDPLMQEGLIDDGKGFLPWVYKETALEVEPCESLFENYSAKDLLNGTARENENKVIGDRIILDPRGDGIFYKHGGWRTNSSRYKANLQNIVKLGQMEMDLEVQNDDR